MGKKEKSQELSQVPATSRLYCVDPVAFFSQWVVAFYHFFQPGLKQVFLFA
jgi:hypothetical protein